MLRDEQSLVVDGPLQIVSGLGLGKQVGSGLGSCRCPFAESVRVGFRVKGGVLITYLGAVVGLRL